VELPRDIQHSSILCIGIEMPRQILTLYRTLVSSLRISPEKSSHEDLSIKQERYCLSGKASVKANLRELFFLAGHRLPRLR
jgi:hypothetical protein